MFFLNYRRQGHSETLTLVGTASLSTTLSDVEGYFLVVFFHIQFLVQLCSIWLSLLQRDDNRLQTVLIKGQ